MLSGGCAQRAGLGEVAHVVKTSLVAQPGNQARQAPVPASADEHQVKLAIRVKVPGHVTSRGSLFDHLDQVLKRSVHVAEVALSGEADCGNLKQLAELDDLGQYLRRSR